MTEDNLYKKKQDFSVPIWKKYMLTVEEATQYFGIGEKKLRNLIVENRDTDLCFTVQIGNKSLINRKKFEEFLNQTTALQAVFISNLQLGRLTKILSVVVEKKLWLWYY